MLLKNNLLFVLFAVVTCLQAQTTFYTQDFSGSGLPSGWTSSTASTTIMSNVPSDNAGASGGNNLFMANCQPSGEARSVTVSSLSTVGYTGISLSFGHRRTGSFDVNVALEWSADGGVSWNAITYSTPSTTSSWSLFSSANLPAAAEDQSDFSVRWSWVTNSNNGCATAVPNYRIDDFKLIGESTVPINLLSFTAERRGEQALISWSTSAEEENDYMAVERSQDGVRFREIGRVSGAGTTDWVQRYSFLDERPGNGLNYYRLRQVDFDGSFEYHRIATLDFRRGAATGTQVYPNPTKGDLFLSAQLADDAELLLLNAQGQVLRQFDASQAKAQNSLRTASLPAGVYFLRIASGGQAETLRFVKE